MKNRQILDQIGSRATGLLYFLALHPPFLFSFPTAVFHRIPHWVGRNLHYQYHPCHGKDTFHCCEQWNSFLISKLYPAQTAPGRSEKKGAEQSRAGWCAAPPKPSPVPRHRQDVGQHDLSLTQLANPESSHSAPQSAAPSKHRLIYPTAWSRGQRHIW